MTRSTGGLLGTALLFVLPATGSAQADDDPCLKHDYSAMAVVLSDVGASANEAAAREASRRLGPCLTFVVTITTTMNLSNDKGAQMYLTGTSTFPVTLGAGSLQGADYDFATPPEGVTATMTYSNAGAEGGPCEVLNVAVSKPTKWNFWFGLTLKPDAKAALVASPDEQDVNDVLVRCHGVQARQKTSILAPGWTAAHGEGDDGTAGPVGPDAAKRIVGEMTSGNLADMQAKAKQLEQMQKAGASPEEMGRMMQAMMPGLGAADAALDEAEDNYMIRIPIEAVTGRAELVKYNLSGSKPLKGGQGTVTERTVIEVVHLPSSKL